MRSFLVATVFVTALAGVPLFRGVEAGSAMMADKLVLTPEGPRRASQVHELPPGHVLDASGGRLRELDATGKVVKDYGPVSDAAAGAPEKAPPPKSEQ